MQKGSYLSPHAKFPHTLRKDYYDKELFIKEFVAFCREVREKRREDGRPVMKSRINKFVGVCGEFWQFIVYADMESIWTEAVYFHFDYSTKPPKDLSVHYPETKWGGPYSRWDSELREFLRREINKE